MNIDVFASASGDCVLVTTADGKRLLADAGLPDAYEQFVAGPLAELRTANKQIDVAYVSHIDRDHIGGILRMLDHELKWRAFDFSRQGGSRMLQPKVPRPPEILEIWHNAFLESIEATEKTDLGAALADNARMFSNIYLASQGGSSAQTLVAEIGELALSVGDAIEVNWRIGKDQLDIPLNKDFGGKFMIARKKPVQLGGASILVLGPTAKQLTELRKEWVDWLRNSKDYIERLRQRHQRDSRSIGSATPADLTSLAGKRTLADIEKDVTPPNLASLVLLLEEAGKRVLLTGDAGDTSLLEYLAQAGLLDASGRIEVDVLKVPHHGAHNSFSAKFARSVRAEHLIFCGDGEHHNPEPDVVKGYIEAILAQPLSNGRKTTFWFNCSAERSDEFRNLWQEIEGLFDAATTAAGISQRSLKRGEVQLSLSL